MSISSVPGTDEKTRGWFFDFDQQWTSLLGGCNWYDFTVIHIGGEFAPYSGRWELCLGLLGFNARLTYVYDDRLNRELNGLRDSIQSELEGRTGCEVKDPLGVLDKLDDPR